MTDRYHALTVVLDADIRSDDAADLITAIKQLRHVISVEPHVSRTEDYMARQRVRMELADQLWAVLFTERGGAK